MARFKKQIFLLVFSLLFFVFTEPALAKMTRAPANPVPPVPSSYPIRKLANDIQDVQQWLKEGLGFPVNKERLDDDLSPCQSPPQTQGKGSPKN